jgi:hypothetical protein
MYIVILIFVQKLFKPITLVQFRKRQISLFTSRPWRNFFVSMFSAHAALCVSTILRLFCRSSVSSHFRDGDFRAFNDGDQFYHPFFITLIFEADFNFSILYFVYCCSFSALLIIDKRKQTYWQCFREMIKLSQTHKTIILLLSNLHFMRVTCAWVERNSHRLRRKLSCCSTLVRNAEANAIICARVAEQ